MFMGEYSHSIDAKGRLIIPAKLREQLGTSCIITMGFDACLSVYTQEKWEHISTVLKSQPVTKAGVRALQRLYFGKASEVEFDSQGRILIPPPLRAHARLDKKCIIVGVGESVEIWSEDGWNTYVGEMGPSVEALVEDLDDIRF